MLPTVHALHFAWQKQSSLGLRSWRGIANGCANNCHVTIFKILPVLFVSLLPSSASPGQVTWGNAGFPLRCLYYFSVFFFFPPPPTFLVSKYKYAFALKIITTNNPMGGKLILAKLLLSGSDILCCTCKGMGHPPSAVGAQNGFPGSQPDGLVPSSSAPVCQPHWEGWQVR